MAEKLEKIVEIKLQANDALAQLADYQKRIDAVRATEAKTAEARVLQKQQLTALSNEMRVLAKEVQNEVKMEALQKDSIAGMRAELSNLTKNYDRLTKAERDNAEIGGKQRKEIVELTKKIKDAEEATDRYYRNVGNYKNSILQAIGMNNELGQSLLATGGNFKAMAGVAGQSIKALNASMMTLLANPVFLAIAGIAGAGMAVKWWADYNDGIAEATRLTREFTGLAGDDLTALRSSIQATADVMGKDYTDVLKTADALMAHYHITGAEAMDVINKGFASGADLNGDMLAKLQQMAPAFHDAGIGASEMMAIITQTRSGIFGNDGLQTIQMASIKIREMSSSTAKALAGIGINAREITDALAGGQMSTFEAIKKVSGALKELPDNSQEVAEAIKEVFGKVGRKASQEMIESLADMETNLDKVLEQTGDYGQLLLEQIKSEEELERTTANLFEVEGGGWEAITMKAKIYSNEALTGIVKAMQSVRDAFSESASQFDWWWGKVKSGFTAVGGYFQSIANSVVKLGGVFSGLGTMILGVGQMSPEIIQQGWEEVKSSASGAWGTLKSGFASTYQQYKARGAELDSQWLGSSSVNNYTASGGGSNYSKPTTPTNDSTKKGGGGTSKGGAKGGNSSGIDKVAQAIAQNSIKGIQAQISALVALRDATGFDDIEQIKELTSQIRGLEWQLKNMKNVAEGVNLADKFKINDITTVVGEINDKIIQGLTSPKVEDATTSIQEQLAGVGKTAGDVSTIMGELGRVVQGNAGQWMSWGASVLGSISKALPQLSALFVSNQAVATSEAMAQNAAMGPFGWVAGIAAIGSILAALASVPKFATGGYISGEGTGTSDSIHARLSNGESVINARSTGMFAGLLSALNQFGGGVPIQANASAQSLQGEEMLAQAFMRGAMALPSPVVGVREFTKVNDRVATIKETARL